MKHALARLLGCTMTTVAADINGHEMPLTEMPIGREVRITRIDTSDTAKVHRLASLGILPGGTIRLLQNRSPFVAVVDRDQVAFDRRIASSVWVRADEEPPKK